MPRRYKIVQILPALEIGGIESFVTSLHRYLKKNNLDSVVISSGGGMVESIASEGGTHIEFEAGSKNMFSLISRISKLKKILISLKPDLINVHSRVPAWLTHFANKQLKIPVISTIHGFNHVSPYSAIMTKADHIICVSSSLEEFVLRNYKKVKVENSTVISCGVDETIFCEANINHREKNAILEKYNLEGSFIATTAGRFTKLKDFETFIHAINIAKNDNPKIRGIIKGYVPKGNIKYYNHIHDLIKKLRLEDRVFLITEKINMTTIYALSHIVLSTSKKPESLGLTLIESLFLNKPIIATRHGGPIDIVKQGENGYLFEPENSQALANLFLKLPESNFTNLREKAIKRFSSNFCSQKYMSLYKRIIDNAAIEKTQNI